MKPGTLVLYTPRFSPHRTVLVLSKVDTVYTRVADPDSPSGTSEVITVLLMPLCKPEQSEVE